MACTAVISVVWGAFEVQQDISAVLEFQSLVTYYSLSTRPGIVHCFLVFKQTMSGYFYISRAQERARQARVFPLELIIHRKEKCKTQDIFWVKILQYALHGAEWRGTGWCLYQVSVSSHIKSVYILPSGESGTTSAPRLAADLLI